MAEKMILPRLKISINEIDNGFIVESNYGDPSGDGGGRMTRYVKTLAEAQELIGQIVDEYTTQLELAKDAYKPATLRGKMEDILDKITTLAGHPCYDHWPNGHNRCIA
jgi:hypothetical protein